MLAMPVVLAAAMSKGFSKPDFWSANLALSSFIATRPIATGELVVAKLKAAGAQRRADVGAGVRVSLPLAPSLGQG